MNTKTKELVWPQLSVYNYDTQSYDHMETMKDLTDETIQPYIPHYAMGAARSIFGCYRGLYPDLSTLEIYLKTMLDVKDSFKKDGDK